MQIYSNQMYQKVQGDGHLKLWRRGSCKLKKLWEKLQTPCTWICVNRTN